ncbi:MAG: CHAT domain-containing tetratricopeptide repeat protein [Cyanobacteria bacterium P01_D01_bin.73]
MMNRIAWTKGLFWLGLLLAGAAIAPASLASTLPDPGRSRLVVTHENPSRAGAQSDVSNANNPWAAGSESQSKEAQFLFDKGVSFYRQGLILPAITEWKAALQLFRAEGDRHGEADTLSNLGLAYESQKKYRQAITHHDSALVLHLVLGDRYDGAQNLENAALANYALGDYKEALRLQQQALALRQEFQQHPRMATTLRILGTIYQIRGQFVPAIQAQEEALLLAGLRGDFREMMLSQRGLGQAYQKLAQFDKAVDFAQRSLETSRQLGDREAEIAALNDLGSSYLRIQELDLALEAYNRALELQGGGDRGGSAGALGNVGAVQAASGNLTRATAIYEEGLRLVRQVGDRRGEATSLADLGLVQAKAGDLEGAVDFYLRALQANRVAKDPVQKATILTRLGQVTFELGRLERSAAFLRHSGDIRDTLGAKLSNGDTNKTVLLEEQYHTYRLLQKVLIASDRPEEALEIADRARSQSLVEYLVESDDGAPQDRDPLTIRQIRRLARDQRATLVMYSNLGDTQLLAWVVSPEGEIALHSIDPSELGLSTSRATALARFDASNPVGEAIALWANRVRDNTSVEEEAAAAVGSLPAGAFGSGLRDGYRLLIKPIEASLPKTPGSKVIIVPDRELGLIPFGALMDESNVPVVERFSVSMVPSLKALTALNTRGATRIQSEQNELVIGNPAPMPQGLSSLPGAEQEAIAIAKLRRVSPLLGPAATEAVVKEEYTNAGWLHFATHGTFNDNGGNDLSSWLALAPLGDREDGLLSMGEVFNSKIRAEMVVLSACDTGQGRVTGEGIVGLARAFLKAGSSSVVASLWKVPDESTALLMETFYKELATGKGKAESLREAIRTTRSQYPHPRHWAAFVLMGAS